MGAIHTRAKRSGPRRFAHGKRAKFQCPICGLVMRHDVAVKDWRGQWVGPECNDPFHPQEIPVITDDAVALAHPRPSNDRFPVTVNLPRLALIVTTRNGAVTVTGT